MASCVILLEIIRRRIKADNQEGLHIYLVKHCETQGRQRQISDLQEVRGEQISEERGAEDCEDRGGELW